jgi:hypothetical protein
MRESCCKAKEDSHSVIGTMRIQFPCCNFFTKRSLLPLIFRCVALRSSFGNSYYQRQKAYHR